LSSGNQPRTCRSNKKVRGFPVEVGMRLEAAVEFFEPAPQADPEATLDPRLRQERLYWFEPSAAGATSYKIRRISHADRAIDAARIRQRMVSA
jgi:hypothetical protein